MKVWLLSIVVEYILWYKPHIRLIYLKFVTIVTIFYHTIIIVTISYRKRYFQFIQIVHKNHFLFIICLVMRIAWQKNSKIVKSKNITRASILHCRKCNKRGQKRIFIASIPALNKIAAMLLPLYYGGMLWCQQQQF